MREDTTRILGATLRESLDSLKVALNEAMELGKHPHEVAFVIERDRRGETSVAVRERARLAPWIGSLSSLDAETRSAALATLAHASVEEIVVVVLVKCEGYTAFGVRTL